MKPALRYASKHLIQSGIKHRRLARLRSACQQRGDRALDAGFSIVEVMVAVLIATSALLLLVPALSDQLAVSRQASRMTAVESAVSLDLLWLNNYARFWRMSRGVYSLDTRYTKAPTYERSAFSVYDPPADRCRNGTLANGFLSDAQDLFNNRVAYAVFYTSLLPRYQPVTTAVTIPVASAVVNGAQVNQISLTRRLYPLGNRIVATYSLGGTDVTGLRFTRAASIFLEASAWCDVSP